MIEMRPGDLGLFYHSSIPEPAAVGICEVVRRHIPTSRSSIVRASTSTDAPSPINRSGNGRRGLPQALRHPVTLARLRAEPRLTGMALLERDSGYRFSRLCRMSGTS